MPITVRAIYSGGVLRPTQPLALQDGQAVELTVTPAASAPTGTPLPDDEIIRRLQGCKTYHEWLEVTKLLPADDAGYDIVEALNANRRWSGDRPIMTDQGSAS